MNLEEAKSLKHGSWIHHVRWTNADGSPCRFKVLSVKTWKTRPNQVIVSLKRGLYQFLKIREYELEDFAVGYD